MRITTCRIGRTRTNGIIRTMCIAPPRPVDVISFWHFTSENTISEFLPFYTFNWCHRYNVLTRQFFFTNIRCSFSVIRSTNSTVYVQLGYWKYMPIMSLISDNKRVNGVMTVWGYVTSLVTWQQDGTEPHKAHSGWLLVSYRWSIDTNPPFRIVTEILRIVCWISIIPICVNAFRLEIPIRVPNFF